MYRIRRFGRHRIGFVKRFAVGGAIFTNRRRRILVGFLVFEDEEGWVIRVEPLVSDVKRVRTLPPHVAGRKYILSYVRVIIIYHT